MEPKHTRVGPVQVIILRMIRQIEAEAGSQYAYGKRILDAIETRTQHTMNVGALYGTLHRLELRGFVSAHEQPSMSLTGRQRRRRVYALTSAGLAAISGDSAGGAGSDTPLSVGWTSMVRRPLFFIAALMLRLRRRPAPGL
jgi:hypothetical protein